MLLCLLACLLASGAPAQDNGGAAPPAAAAAPSGNPTPAQAGTPTPAQARQLLETVSNPHARAALTQTLATLAKSAPAAPTKPALPLAPDSLGAELLLQGANWVDHLSQQVRTLGHAFADVPLALRWFSGLLDDPDRRASLIEFAWRGLLVLAVAGLAETLLIRVLRRPIAAITDGPVDGPPRLAGDPESLTTGDPWIDTTGDPEIEAQRREGDQRLRRTWRGLSRLPFVLLRLLLDLVPIALFATVATIGAGFTVLPITRLVLLALINATVICRLATCLARMLVAPDAPQLRLVRVSDDGAAYTLRWIRRLAVVATFGYAFASICLLYGLPSRADQALLKLILLTDHVFLVVIVLQIRVPVAKRIRARTGRTGVLALLQNRLAASWHIIAIFYIVALWIVWAAEVRDGYGKIWRLFIVTCAVSIAARLLAIIVLGSLDRVFRITPELAERYPGIEIRANSSYTLVRGALSGLLLILTGLALLEAWGLPAIGWLQRSRLGAHIVAAVFTTGIAALAAAALWEAVNVGLDRHQAALTRDAQFVRLARVRTLLPIVRTALFIALLVVFGLTALSEIGVNIAPLLAGAGILGVAIGFGSQKLVQDFITGIFLLLENAMQVGDTVTLAGLSGTVETLSIRTIRLRAGDGSIHIIPFSSVSTVTNVNRGRGNAAVSVTIDASQDTDAAADALVDIAHELRVEPAYEDMILDDFALWGVDKVEGQGVTLVGQIPCTDAGRWGVQREFNRRLHKRFLELGIRLAVPVQLRLQPSAIEPPPAVAHEDAPAEETLIASPPPSSLGNTQ